MIGSNSRAVKNTVLDVRTDYEIKTKRISEILHHVLNNINNLEPRKRNEMHFRTLGLAKCRALRPRIGLAEEGPKSSPCYSDGSKGSRGSSLPYAAMIWFGCRDVLHSIGKEK